MICLTCDLPGRRLHVSKLVTLAVTVMPPNELFLGAPQSITPRVTRQSGTHTVIMAPTRELCIQIYDVLSLVLRRYHWVVRLWFRQLVYFPPLFCVKF